VYAELSGIAHQGGGCDLRIPNPIDRDRPQRALGAFDVLLDKSIALVVEQRR